jgi:hypothetical protein
VIHHEAAYLVYVGDGSLSCVVREGLVGETGLGGLGNVVGGSTAENNDVEQRVGTEPVCSVHRRAACLARSVEARHNLAIVVTNLGHNLQKVQQSASSMCNKTTTGYESALHLIVVEQSNMLRNQFAGESVC